MMIKIATIALVLVACGKDGGKPGGSGGTAAGSSAGAGGGGGGGDTTEAKLQLTKLGKRLNAYYAEKADLPNGTVTTPAKVCCPGKCTTPASEWAASPVWKDLDFSIEEPHTFQYTYESDGKTSATVKATGCGSTTPLLMVTIADGKVMTSVN